MKPRTYQILQIKAGYGGRGVMNHIKVWPCVYPNCNRLLNDVDNHLTTIYCKHHKEVRIKEKNHACYVKRRGETRPNKIDLIIHLLQTNDKASSYELMAYSGVKNSQTFRSDISYLRRKGYKIYKHGGFYFLELRERNT